MPKKAQTKAPKGKGFWKIVHPGAQSERNVKIWRAVIIDGRTQVSVAQEHEITQARVSQIVRNCKRYVAGRRPFGGEDWHPDEQISYTNQVNKLRLEKQFEDTLVGYAVSKLPTVTDKVRAYWEVKDGKEEVVRKVADQTTKTVPQGDVRFLQQQLRLCDQMRKIDLSQATLPVARVSLFPDLDQKHMTAKEKADVFQKLFLRWYDMQQQLESQQTGKPAKQWPIEEYIDIEGRSVQEELNKREQALKEREEDIASREFDLQCMEKRLKQFQQHQDQQVTRLANWEDRLTARSSAAQSSPTQSSPTQSSPSLRDAVPATESRPTLEKRPTKNDYVQNNYPPETVKSVYFPTRADELAYLNKGLYSEGDMSRERSAQETHRSPSPRDANRAESRAAMEQRAKTRAAILQHMRDMQFKHTFYDKDGNVTDVCPWETPKKA